MSNGKKGFCLFLALIGGCVTATNSGWNEYSVRFGEQVFSIELPSHESKNFPPEAPLTFVDFSDDRLDIDAQSVTAIEKYWDFGGGIFQRVRGALILHVRMRKAPLNFNGDLTNYDTLKRLLTTRLIDSSGVSPLDYHSETINGADWVAYKVVWSDRPDLKSTSYILPLSENYYLQVQANFINNNRDNLKWLDEAHKMFTAIASSMYIK